MEREDVLAALCHHYPGYTLETLRRLPMSDVRILRRSMGNDAK